MKAEHRKELETNLLREQLSKLMGRTKSSSKVMWGFAAGLILLGFLYWWWTGRAANRITVAWIDYWHSSQAGLVGEETLKRMEELHKGTAAARAARLTIADETYERGYTAMFSKTHDKEGLVAFNDAAKIYQEVLNDAGNSNDLAMRATLGLAKCEEARGDLPRALHFYQEMIDRFGKSQQAEGLPHPLVAEAIKRKDRLDAKAGDAARFYKGWPERLPKSEMPKAPAGDSPTTPPALTPPPEK